jgi:hypothetical protein
VRRGIILWHRYSTYHTYRCCRSGIPNPTKKDIPSSLTLPQGEHKFYKSIFNPNFFTKLLEIQIPVWVRDGIRKKLSRIQGQSSTRSQIWIRNTGSHEIYVIEYGKLYVPKVAKLR